jgi:hypothetical protein
MTRIMNNCEIEKKLSKFRKTVVLKIKKIIEPQ